jgi:hypothetical protein
MTKEEIQKRRTEIISNMLDNPNEIGIYPTTKCFKELDELIFEYGKQCFYASRLTEVIPPFQTACDEEYKRMYEFYEDYCGFRDLHNFDERQLAKERYEKAMKFISYNDKFHVSNAVRKALKMAAGLEDAV